MTLPAMPQGFTDETHANSQAAAEYGNGRTTIYIREADCDGPRFHIFNHERDTMVDAENWQAAQIAVILGEAKSLHIDTLFKHLVGYHGIKEGWNRAAAIGVVTHHLTNHIDTFTSSRADVLARLDALTPSTL